MKKLLLLLAIVALACGYAGYPYLTLQRIERAAMARDEGTVNALVDWTRVREGIKADVQSVVVAAEMAKKGPTSGGGILGSMLGVAMVDKLLDTLIGPEMLYKIFASRAATDKLPSEYMVGSRFISPTIFQADFRPETEKPVIVTITMEFAGLTWKVSRVSLPMRELMGADTMDDYLKKKFAPK